MQSRVSSEALGGGGCLAVGTIIVVLCGTEDCRTIQ